MSQWMRDKWIKERKDPRRRSFQDAPYKEEITEEITVNKNKLRQLEKDVDLKCCGNCKHYDDTICCNDRRVLVPANGVCDDWGSDVMTRTQRKNTMIWRD